MFQKAELVRLRERKALLVLEGDMNRLALKLHWQKITSPGHWAGEAGRSVSRHPVLTASLAAIAGLMTVKAVRHPGIVAGGIGRLGSLASTAFTVWKLLRQRKSEE